MRGLRYGQHVDQVVRDLVAGLKYASYDRARSIYRLLLKEPINQNDLAYAACNDRFFLLTCLLRRKDAFHPWIYDRCREVEAEPDDALDLWARYHYKSSLITFAGSIQELLVDPEITIAIFSVTDKIAGKFLAQIKEELENNELLKALFPDVLYADPAKEAQLWSAKEGIIVKRQGNPREATVSAYGLLQALPTGSHFRLRIYDDVINEKVTTKTDTDQIKKITNQWELSQNLGVAHGGRKWHIGTRYLIGDTYGDLLGRGIFKERIHAATDDGRINGNPVFLSSEAWEKIKNEQRTTLAAQMLQNPLATSENTFKLEHLKPYSIRPRLMNVYILGDPSKGRTKRSDRTAFAVVGVDSNSNRYLLDGFCHRMRLSERYDNLKLLYEKWTGAIGVQHVRVGYEVYGLQTDTEYFEEKFLADKLMPDMVEVNWVRQGRQSKDDRIERLEPYFRNNKFWLPPKVWVPNKGTCDWAVELDKEGRPVNAQPTFTPLGDPPALSRIERAAVAAGEQYRIMQPIIRKNENRQPYDLVREFFDEFTAHPFSPRDDFLDATSRIEDVDPTPPMTQRAVMDLEPIPYPDF